MSFNFMAAVTFCTDFGAQKNKDALLLLTQSSEQLYPLQCSCLENPRDGTAWWAAVYGVEESRTGLKRLRSSSSSEQGLSATVRVAARRLLTAAASLVVEHGV